MLFFLAALTRPCLVIGKTRKADGIHTDHLNIEMFKAGTSSCLTLSDSEMLVCNVCPAFKEPDEDLYRIALKDFEAMMDCLQYKPFILDAGVVEEDRAKCVKSRLVECSRNDSERLLAKSHNRELVGHFCAPYPW